MQTKRLPQHGKSFLLSISPIDFSSKMSAFALGSTPPDPHVGSFAFALVRWAFRRLRSAWRARQGSRILSEWPRDHLVCTAVPLRGIPSLQLRTLGTVLCRACLTLTCHRRSRVSGWRARSQDTFSWCGSLRLRHRLCRLGLKWAFTINYVGRTSSGLFFAFLVSQATEKRTFVFLLLCVFLGLEPGAHGHNWAVDARRGAERAGCKSHTLRPGFESSLRYIDLRFMWR